MLVKIAKLIVEGMKQGLKGTELDAAVTAALTSHGKSTAETLTGDANAVVNEYKQHVWKENSMNELIGTKKTAPKAKKTAPKAKKTAPKANRPTIASETVKLILAGKSNADAAIALKKNKALKIASKNPGTCVAWYRAQMKKSPKKFSLKSASAVPASK